MTGGFCDGGLLLGGFLSRGIFFVGISVVGFFSVGFFPGGFYPGTKVCMLLTRPIKSSQFGISVQKDAQCSMKKTFSDI